MFLGLGPYQPHECEYLPARAQELRMMTYMLDKNQVSVLSGEPKTGKTSLINAAARTENLAGNKAAAIIFNIPQFHFGDLVLEKQLTAAINALCDKPTYLDLAMEDDHSLWFASKKMQATWSGCSKFYLIFDQFENLFTYGQAAQNEFASAISSLMQGDIPASHKEQIQKLMFGEGDTQIPKNAMPLLIDSPKINILISINKDQYGDLARLNPIIHGILQNTLEINPFDVETAREAIATIASQPIEGLPAISVEHQAAESIASHYAQSGGTVNPGKLRNAILYLRKTIKTGTCTPEALSDSKLLEKSWTREVLALMPDKQQSLMDFVGGEMMMEGEHQPLPVYQGIASKRYNLDDETLGRLEEYQILRRQVGRDGRNYYLPFNGETTRELMPTLAANSTRKQTPRSAGLPTPTPTAENRTRKTKPLIYALIFIVLICLTSVLLAFQLKGDVLREANASRSNMLAATSFQKLDADPTLSLRLAQKAVRLDSANIQAYSALLNAYYNTDIFYNICGEMEGKIAKAEISADGQYIMAYIKNDATEKYAARIMNQEGYVMLEVPHKSEVTSISMAGGMVITTSYDSTARVFDMDGKLMAEVSGHKAILWAADISPDGKHIITAGSDCNLMLWTMDGKPEATFQGHDWDVYSARFSPDGRMILSSSGDNTARLWTSDGKTIKVLEINEDNRFSQSIVSQAIFSPDCKYVLMAANDRLNINHRARLWDISGKELVTFGGHKEFINSVAFSPDGSQIITSSRDKIVRVFSLSGRLEKVLKGHSSNVWSSQFLPDNQGIITVGDDHTIRTWTIGKRFESYDNAVNVNYATFSPNGINLLVVQDSVAQLWDLTGDVMATMKGHHANINKARFAPNGNSVATAAKDGSVYIWDTRGNITNRFSDHADEVFDVVFSPDGQTMVTVSCDSSIVIRNLSTNKVMKARGHDGCVTCVSFAPDGLSLATGGTDGKVVIHDLEGNAIRTFQGHDARVNSVNYSPNGKNIISTSSDETAVLWDNIGQILYTFRGYENKVNSAVFSPDGKFILTTSDDGSARMWTTNGVEVINFSHDGTVSDAVFSPDGRHIITMYRTYNGMKTLKLRMLKADGITMRIDEKALSGTIWQPDSTVLRKYGVE